MDKDDIKTLRNRMGLSMANFGKLFKVNYHTISSWEKGKNTPHEYNIDRLRQLWKEQFRQEYSSSINEVNKLTVFNYDMTQRIIENEIRFLNKIA